MHLLPSIFNRKSPVEIVEKYWPRIFFSGSASLGRDAVNRIRSRSKSRDAIVSAANSESVGRIFQQVCMNYSMQTIRVRAYCIMPERDRNDEASKQVEKATGSEPTKSKDLLESEDQERKVGDSKKRITDENTSRPTS
ncbi:MAG: hypothetical protein DME65_02935 [Verrucomicrobia bacterium]|nr:MAG: hypothetical protein DME65_02935 [Verrucomicrobiota bacterium]